MADPPPSVELPVSSHLNYWQINHWYDVRVDAELHDDDRITAFGLFAEVYTGLVTRLSAQLAEHGLSLVEFEVLVRLARSPDHQLRMTALAGQVALTTSGITRVVDRLERDQLVSRRACPSDRRGSSAVLTGAGLTRLTAALPGHLALLEQHFTSRFPLDELALLVTRLREIRDQVHPAARPDGDQPEPSTGRTGGRNHRPARSVVDHPGESVSARQ